MKRNSTSIHINMVNVYILCLNNSYPKGKGLPRFYFLIQNLTPRFVSTFLHPRL